LLSGRRYGLCMGLGRISLLPERRADLLVAEHFAPSPLPRSTGCIFIQQPRSLLPWPAGW
jgi:hypothetical protein